MNPKNDLEPFNQFRLKVYDLVKKIPRGRVMTYGGIASRVSRPPGIDPLAYRRIRARWVGYAMKSCPEDLPWWRVVNRQGKISLRSGHGPHIQPKLLREEGVVFDINGKLSLDKYLWEPDQNAA
jgi:methylated-DNA-protein-cysteine methyltransferase-like protein